MKQEVNAQVQECLVLRDHADENDSPLPPINPITSWLSKSTESIALASPRGRGDGLKPLTYSNLHEVLDCAPRFASASGRVALLFAVNEAPQLAAALLCTLHRGCSAFPMDQRLLAAGNSTFSAAIRQMRCTTAIVSQSLLEEAKVLLSAEGLRVYSCSQKQNAEIGRLDWKEEAGGDVTASSGIEAVDDEPRLLLTSSGTTGAPKVVPVRGSKLLFNARCMAASLNLDHSDHALNAMPLFHIGGISCPLFATLVSGGCLTQMDAAFDPAEFVAQLEDPDAGPSWYFAAPTLHRAILMCVAAQGKEKVANRLRFVRSGAAHLPAKDAEALEQVFGCSVMPTYSMSESMPICSVPPGWRPSSGGKLDTVGRPIAPSLRIADPNTAAALPYGAVGEVMIRGQGVFDGYEGVDNAAIGAMVTSADGKVWFRTGDVGTMDHDGFVSLRGRSKEVLKRGGEQVSLHEVDEALRAHPDVAIAVTFGVQNDFWGEEVAAAVVLRTPGSVTADAILAEVRERLEGYKVPRQLLLLESDHRLPQTAAGKYKRFDIAAALGVKPMDHQAAAAVAEASVGFSQGAEAFTAVDIGVADDQKTEEDHSSGHQALYGLRFLLAFWVCQYHVGQLPNEELTRVQGFSLNISGFMILAGFLLASSTSEAIQPQERRGFWVSRIAATHGCYLFALLFALPMHFKAVDVDPGQLAAKLAINIFGFNTLGELGHMINAVLWFQSVYYQLVFLFPFIDRAYRAMSYPLMCAVTLALFGMASVILRLVPTRFNFTITTWIWSFCASVGMAHILRRGWAPLTMEQRKFWVSMWAVVTDLLSVGWLVLAILVSKAVGDDASSDLFAFTEREITNLAHNIGWLRGGTLPLAMWVYGMAASNKSITARIFSAKFLVRRLSPLAMPIYMLHLPVAMYVYYALHDGEVPVWAPFAGAYVVPLEWYWLLVVFAISALLGHIYNEYVNPVVFPYVMAFVKYVFDVVITICCGGFSLCPTPEVDVEQGGSDSQATELAVVTAIRRLTGATADRQSKLRAIGLDSFGTTALCGALRSVLPAAAKGLRPVDLLRLQTVGDLIDKLDLNLRPVADSSSATV